MQHIFMLCPPYRGQSDNCCLLVGSGIVVVVVVVVVVVCLLTVDKPVEKSGAYFK